MFDFEVGLFGVSHRCDEQSIWQNSNIIFTYSTHGDICFPMRAIGVLNRWK